MKNLYVVSRVFDTESGPDVTPVKICKRLKQTHDVMVEDKQKVEELVQDGYLRNTEGHRYRVTPVPVI